MKPRIEITGAEFNVIEAIVNRALVFFPDRDWRDIKMGLVATHLNNPLRLQDLLDADDGDFVHDIAGIERHLDHFTFQLKDCFSPRFTDQTIRKKDNADIR